MKIDRHYSQPWIRSINKLFASFLVRITLVPLTRMGRNRADVDDKTMAISLDPRTGETIPRRKCRAHCALSVQPTYPRISGACGALCFKTVARKQIRMAHVARISRSTVCLRVGYVGVDLYIGNPFPRVHPRLLSTPDGGFLLFGAQRARTHRQLRHFIARVTCRARN